MKNYNDICKSFILSVVLLTAGAVFMANGQCVSPSAQVSPAHITVIQGDSVSIYPTIVGTEPIDYQWFCMRTGIIKGATKSSYTAHNVLKADTVYLRVMNKCGQKFSNPVYLELDTVNPPKQTTVKPKTVAKPKKSAK